ncbi:MAG: ATP-binding cassette domain-containing protein, partial [Proteobacteria bacterium]|nr:ATP-binding cassette domain-containing protein [Pseudomonadota bacterium]
MSMIIARDLVKTYGKGSSLVRALDSVSLEIDAGQFTAVMGPSGSGKSTLLAVLGALNTPEGGSYLVDGIEVFSLGQDQRADFRREYLGFVFQSFNLVPYLSLA